jgi:hypothetical protein
MPLLALKFKNGALVMGIRSLKEAVERELESG